MSAGIHRISKVSEDQDLLNVSFVNEIQELGILVRDLSSLQNSAPFVGRNTELQGLACRLLSFFRPNALLVGPSGSGKTSLVEALSFYCQTHEQPRLRRMKFLEVNAGSLLADTQYRGDFEKKILGLVNILLRFPQVVLFVDEAHCLALTGDVHGGGVDALNLLKPFLLNRQLRVILATTSAEVGIFEKDEAFLRRFFRFELDFLPLENCRDAFFAHARNLEAFHGVSMNPKELEDFSFAQLKAPQDLTKSLDALDQNFVKLSFQSIHS